jgi:uncharacterized protein YnzC (UPF0291/DUF896 family)
MKNRRERAKQVRQRKVAALAAYSRRHTVKNCTIPKLKQASTIDESGNGEWTIPDNGYKQPKTLRKKYKKKYYAKVKDTTFVRGDVWKIITQSSDYLDFPDHTPKKLGKAWFMEQVVQHKIAKWEKKNPCPVKPNQNPPDMFEEEYVIPWKARREVELERIRDFVVSVYDKLHVVGNRVDKENHKMTGHTVAEIKDIDQKGHNVTHPNLKESDQLYKNATKAAQVAMDKDPTIVDCDLKNHRGDQKRPLINAKRGSAKTLKDVKKSHYFKKAA